jgi:hypothetical protein
MSSSETESTASDMSDLSYEQELGEVGEGSFKSTKAPCNILENYLPRLTRECPSLSIAMP